MKKVLIIEDDKFVSKVMKYKFEEKKFEVNAVGTAEEGLQILAKGKFIPDAIILDILLPGIDGYEFLKKIKGDSKLNKIPVIVASNIPEGEKPTHGTAEYIIKSDLDLDDLVKKTLRNIKS